MFFLVLLFIFSLIIFDYHYNIAEYITTFGSLFFTTSFIMFTYEKVKESENIRLSEYAKKLQKRSKNTNTGTSITK